MNGLLEPHRNVQMLSLEWEKLQQGLSKATGSCKLTDGFATAVLIQIASSKHRRLLAKPLLQLTITFLLVMKQLLLPVFQSHTVETF